VNSGATEGQTVPVCRKALRYCWQNWICCRKKKFKRASLVYHNKRLKCFNVVSEKKNSQLNIFCLIQGIYKLAWHSYWCCNQAGQLRNQFIRSIVSEKLYEKVLFFANRGYLLALKVCDVNILYLSKLCSLKDRIIKVGILQMSGSKSFRGSLVINDSNNDVMYCYVCRKALRYCWQNWMSHENSYFQTSWNLRLPEPSSVL
jgi:hypothetical protein